MVLFTVRMFFAFALAATRVGHQLDQFLFGQLPAMQVLNKWHLLLQLSNIQVSMMVLEMVNYLVLKSLLYFELHRSIQRNSSTF
jgi:hypothetical protein